jgi:hypothetical protein
MIDEQPFEPVDTSRYPTSVRVLFAFDAEGVHVKSMTQVEMTAPTTPFPLPERATGTWVQLCDSAGDVLFYRILYAELYPRRVEQAGADGKLTTVASPTNEGEFDVVLPLIDAATEIQVIRYPPRPDGGGSPKPQRWTFPVEEAR